MVSCFATRSAGGKLVPKLRVGEINAKKKKKLSGYLDGFMNAEIFCNLKLKWRGWNKEAVTQRAKF